MGYISWTGNKVVNSPLHESAHNRTTIAGLSALVAILLALPLAGVSYAESTISVTGSAAASVQPDIARVWFSVYTLNDTATDSLSANSKLVRSALDSVRQAGVDDEEISTAGFDIRAEYDSYTDERGRYMQEFAGYAVTNTVLVTTDEPDTAAAIIDAAVSGGANRVDGIEFALSDVLRAGIENTLVAQAVGDAASKARYAIAPLGYHIKGVVSMEILEYSDPWRASYDTREFAAASSAPPIHAGDQDITVTAHVEFEISRD